MAGLDWLGGAMRVGAVWAALATSGCILFVGDDDGAAGDTEGSSSGDTASDESSGGGDASLDETGADGGGYLDCSMSYVIQGSVDGVDASYSDYWVDTTLYNLSLEEVVLSEIDFEVMAAMGLEPEDPEDVERYEYFSSGFELRNLYLELLDETYFDFLSKIGRDLSVAFFDLSESEVQPGTPIAVFDVSPIEAVRNSGDLQALGDTVRALIDEMRTNGQQDAVVTFAPDRSSESPAEAIFISMFSPNARFGTSGTATFGGLLDDVGEPVESMPYPMTGVVAMSVSVDATFTEGELSLDATCLPTAISG